MIEKGFYNELEQADSSVCEETMNDEGRFLILLNDEVNTFDHVIESLVDVCNHSFEQAEQCAMITHLKGKCEVKRGTLTDLQKYKTALEDRYLSAEIN